MRNRAQAGRQNQAPRGRRSVHKPCRAFSYARTRMAVARNQERRALRRQEPGRRRNENRGGRDKRRGKARGNL